VGCFATTPLRYPLLLASGALGGTGNPRIGVLQDPGAANTLGRPESVVPRSNGDAKLTNGRFSTSLPRLSLIVIILSRHGAA